jgi:hypothetical protein
LITKKSFTIHTSTTPQTVVINNAILETNPFVADKDILVYTKVTSTFTILKDIYPIIKDFGMGMGFAITVDDNPIYYGRFHPAFLSSITFGVSTIDPAISLGSELPIHFALLNGNAMLQSLDQRNDERILYSLRETNRLR